MEQQRVVWTPHGQIMYTLIRKQVKNLNLRIGAENMVFLSVPPQCPAERADEFVITKSGWITDHLRLREERAELLPELDQTGCRMLLMNTLRRVYPLVEPYGVPVPQLKIRAMRTQWGNCHWTQGYVTLNTALHRCPEHLRAYVALHELVHFLHHDHGNGFYAVMDTLMPDWKRRRQELKLYAHAIRKS